MGLQRYAHSDELHKMGRAAGGSFTSKLVDTTA
jgi:hypothetical protein